MKPGRAAARLAVALNRWSDRWLPSALGIAVALSVATFALAFVFGYTGVPVAGRPLEALQAWGAGLSGLLAFAMQMCLVMLTGLHRGHEPAVPRGCWTRSRASRAGPRAAVAWMGFLSMALGLLNWGVSIVGGAVLARALARRRTDVDYRLLVAAAYLGLGCTWHAGLSASAPLTVAAREERFRGRRLPGRTRAGRGDRGLAVQRGPHRVVLIVA